MASNLMSLDQCRSCKENVEFLFKLDFSSFQLCGTECKLGFADLILSITLDGVVTRVMELDEEISCDLLFQATPESFNEKLKSTPIMMNLSRGKDDLGTLRIEISECFSDALMCDEFENQRFQSEYKFNVERNGKMMTTCGFDLIIHLTRKESDCRDFIDYLRKREIARQQKMKKKLESEIDEFSMNESSVSFACDDDVIEYECPFEFDFTSTSFPPPSTSKSKTSLKSKCKSDIATSLDINDIKDACRTFCPACGGFSISGITCANKDSMPSLPKVECKLPSHRICSECFEDLSVIPHNAPCPKCEAYHRQMQRVVCFKSDKQELNEQEKIRSCLRTIFEDILLGDKSRVEKDLKRLKGDDCGMKKKRKRKINEICGKKKKARNPRCDKVKKVLQNAQKTFKLRHPGIVRGHDACKLEQKIVPKDMGWLWNVQNPGIPRIRRGWKPGAVPRKIARMMKFFLIEEQQLEPDSPQISSEKPGLHMKRTKGEYTIKMNNFPGGDGPITFKIAKTDEAHQRSQTRKILKKRGIEKKCDCEKIEECQCINECMKKEVKEALKNISTELSLTPEFEFCELNESSDSELDFNFTPPIITTRPKVSRRPTVSNAATQYEEQKIEEVIIEQKKIEVKKLQQAIKGGNSKATKSTLKGGKIMMVKKKEEMKKSIGGKRAV